MTHPDIYALMVTGKNEQRIQWARQQVMKFMTQQSYSGTKRILIANEHPSLHVLDSQSKFREKVNEIHISDRHLVSLGQIRNQLLALVPSGSYVMILDDDDYISPTFLTQMIEYWHQQKPKTVMVQMGNRLNHNSKIGSSWQSSHPSGFVHFVADIDLLRSSQFQYFDRNSLEDLSIHEFTSRTIWHDSPPELYIRYIHGDNTSLYVNPQQSQPNTDLGEIPVSQEMSQLCLQHVPNEWQENATNQVLEQKCRLTKERGFIHPTTLIIVLVSLLLCWFLLRRRRISS